MGEAPYDRADLKTLAISETGFVFDPRTGHSYSLNSTGLVVLGAMREGKTLAEIAARLREEFDAGDGAQDDVEGFFELLRELGLLGARGTK